MQIGRKDIRQTIENAERLKPAAEQIRKHGTAGYQENIADLVVREER